MSEEKQVPWCGGDMDGLKTRTRAGLYARDTWLDSALLVHDEPDNWTCWSNRARGELQTKCLGILY